MKNLDEYTEEEAQQMDHDLMKGLEGTILDLQRSLDAKVDGLTQKQLRRALRAIINFPKPINGEGIKEREARFVAELATLHQNQVMFEIQVIGELQKEQLEKENTDG